MAFERNDIVNKNRLMGELGEELMGFEHNDIVTVDVMNEAIAEGGGGGGGETVNWLIDNVTATVAYDAELEQNVAVWNLPESITSANIISTLKDKTCVTIWDGVRVEAPTYYYESDNLVYVYVARDLDGTFGEMSYFVFSETEIRAVMYFTGHLGDTYTLSLGIVEE